ncbi:hypothetical protein Tco_0272643 [Tanacetum coccineum]
MEAEWLKNLLLKIPLWVKPMTPISIRCDSASTLAKAYSQMYNRKSRHLVSKQNDTIREYPSEKNSGLAHQRLWVLMPSGCNIILKVQVYVGKTLESAIPIEAEKSDVGADQEPT